MKRSVSFRTKILLVFMVVVLAIIGIFYVMNRMFWNRYYMRSNEKIILETYTELKDMVARGDPYNDDLMQAAMSAKTAQNISFALQGDRDWEFRVVTRKTISEYEMEFLLKRLQDNLLNATSEGIKILEQQENYTLQHVTVEEGAQYLECYGYMTDGLGQDKKFILSMPLDPFMDASSASNIYFIYISLAVLLLGSVLIYLITIRMTRPILKLSDLSKRMSRLDFSARYTGTSSDEIGELGNNMNELSSQLERTILQLRMANDNLQKDLAEKEQVDEMRKDFISNVSHELKTPIALIQGYAEGLKEMRDDPDSMDYYIDVITDEADKMNRMVKKLMTLNQLEFGEDGLTPEVFNIMDMIRGIAENSRKLQEEHGAVLTVEGPEELYVLADEFKIEEVLNNYYSNALNHLDGAHEIRIWANDLGPTVRISVFNTGENIPEEELDKIWIKFYKVDKARTREYGGSGIGLSIVKAIMDAHQKECGVYNTREGVTFWFELQKAPEEVPEEDYKEPEDSEILTGEIVREVDRGGNYR